MTSVVSESFPHLRRGVMRDFLSIMQGHGYYKESLWNRTDCIYTFETGSKIEFFSSDNGDKLRGARRDRLFVNEANNIPFDAFEQLEVRTKDFIFLDWNPTNEFYFYTELLGKRDDIEHITLTYLDNEALSPEIVASIEQRKNRKGWWTVYGLGQLGDVEGKIYKDWEIVDKVPHEARLERRGLDFGYSCFIANTKVKCKEEDKRISELNKGDQVLTRVGYRHVKNVLDNGRRMVIEREFLFEDGTVRRIVGTPDHDFNVNDIWKKLEDITPGDRLYVLMEDPFTDTPAANIQITSISSHKDPSRCISYSTGKSTRVITGTYRKAISFITLMAILLTTRFQIWWLSLLLNTLKYTGISANGTDPRLESNNSKRSGSLRRTGTRDAQRSSMHCEMNEECAPHVGRISSRRTPIRSFVLALVTTAGSIRQRKIKSNSRARTALRGLWGISIPSRNPAQRIALTNSLKVIGARTLREWSENVFNVEVDDLHEYFANGMLVYNCDPSTAVDIYAYNGGYVLDELFYQTGLSNRKIADMLLNQEKILTIADSSEPKSIDELISYGLNVIGANKGPGSVLQGIQYVQDKRISVTKRSVNLIREYRNYLWQTDKNGRIINEPEGGLDHCLDCLVAGTQVRTNGGEKSIENIKIGDSVFTRYGLRTVTDAWLVRQDAEVFDLEFSDGRVLSGTANHRVWLKNKGWTFLRDIRYGDIIQAWKPLSNIMGKGITSILMPSKGRIGCISIMERNTFIGKSGKTLMEKFQMAFMSTISMVIRLTIVLKILRFWIKEFMGKLLGKRGFQLQSPVTHVKKSSNASLYEVWTGSVQTLVKVVGEESRASIILKKTANVVKRILLLINTTKRFFVPVHVRSVAKRDGTFPVYDLTVQENNEYFANGVLVHNSVRYAFNGLRESKPVSSLHTKQWRDKIRKNRHSAVVY